MSVSSRVELFGKQNFRDVSDEKPLTGRGHERPLRTEVDIMHLTDFDFGYTLAYANAKALVVVSLGPCRES